MLNLFIRDIHTCFLGRLHLPKLRKLSLGNCDAVVKSIIHKPMRIVRSLDVENITDPMLLLKLLGALPNLVSFLSCGLWYPVDDDELPIVVLQPLRSLSLAARIELWNDFLACLYVPSLKYLHLDLSHYATFDELDFILRDGTVQLRHLSIRQKLRRETMHQLSHLKTPTFYGLSSGYGNEALRCSVFYPPQSGFQLRIIQAENG
jgi:hypothetical protein